MEEDQELIGIPSKRSQSLALHRAQEYTTIPVTVRNLVNIILRITAAPRT